MTNDKPFIAAHLRNSTAVERAASELRRHLPVLLFHGPLTSALFAIDMVSDDTLHRLRQMGAVHLLLTRERAAILKIRHKGENAVRLACPERLNAADIKAIADPVTDLATPLKGPFKMEPREDDAGRQHDRAALRLLRVAHLLPAALLVELDQSGSDEARHRLIAETGLLSVTASMVADYDRTKGEALSEVARAKLPLSGAEDAEIIAFRPRNGGTEHFALLVGQPSPHHPVLVRLHSECFTGDTLSSLKCDCGTQLKEALSALKEAGGGILLYLAQEGRGIGLVAKLKAYALQDQGYDTVDANLRLGFGIDERAFGPAAGMLKALGYRDIRLLTNNPEKVRGLEEEGLRVVERVAHKFPAGTHNAHYLATKKDRTGHFL